MVLNLQRIKYSILSFVVCWIKKQSLNCEVYFSFQKNEPGSSEKETEWLWPIFWFTLIMSSVTDTSIGNGTFSGYSDASSGSPDACEDCSHVSEDCPVVSEDCYSINGIVSSLSAS